MVGVDDQPSPQQVAPPPPAGATAAPVASRPGRYERSFAGMVGAMILLLLVIGAFVVLRDTNRTQPDNPVEPVEWRSAASYARREADFELLAPRRLPAGWYATSVRLERGDDPSWHLGLLTAEGRYVGLEQATDSAGTMVERFVDEDAVRGDDVVVDGESWQSWTDDEDVALVREGADVTTLVVGTAGRDVVVDFAASLG